MCVLENDVPVLDISAGKQSPYDGTPVAPDTIFNCFSVTKGVAAGAVHMLAERYWCKLIIEECVTDTLCTKHPLLSRPVLA